MGIVGKVLPTFHLPSTIVGISNAVFLIGLQQLKRYCNVLAAQRPKWTIPKSHPLLLIQKIPEVLILVLFMLILSYSCSFSSYYKIRTLGIFDNKLRMPMLPEIVDGQISRLTFPAIMITLTGFIESSSVTRAFGYKKNYFPSVNRELFAFGAANALPAFFGSYVTFGSLPRSRILFNAGGKTVLVGFMASFIVLFATMVYIS